MTDVGHEVTFEQSQERLALLINYVDEQTASHPAVVGSAASLIPIPRRWFCEAMPAYYAWLQANQKELFGHTSNPESVLFRGVFIYPENTQ